MLNPTQIREIRRDAERLLKQVTTNALTSGFTYSLEMPNETGQFWEYELNVAAGNDYFTFKCGCFSGTGTDANRALGVDLFFSNNDRLLEEFILAVESGALDELIPLLERADQLCSNDDTGASISVASYVISNDEWTRGVCEELVLIIHMDEQRSRTLDIGSMQSERHRIKVPSTLGTTYLRVPYDKVACFSGAVRVDTHSSEPFREYQVALSFAGEDRSYVSQVARYLRKAKVRFFYDEYENVNLWGKDLYLHLDEIYRKRARYCVMFLSEHYRRKLWTNHERTSAQARAFEEHSEYILPVKLDNTEIQGIRSTTGYVERLPPKKLAEMISKKVNT